MATGGEIDTAFARGGRGVVPRGDDAAEMLVIEKELERLPPLLLLLLVVGAGAVGAAVADEVAPSRSLMFAENPTM